MKKAIIIMAKVPMPGKVKTRMQPDLSELESTELSTAFLLDAELKTTAIGCDSIIAFYPEEESDKLKHLLRYKHILIPQQGENLGRRMFNAFRSAFENGAGSVVMIGTDSPTFPSQFIVEAFNFLEQDADVVLGETEDGGFYLIGFKDRVRDIFGGVAWSTQDAFDQTVQNIKDCRLEVKMLPVWYDIDLPGDLQRLNRDLKLKPASAPNSYQWLIGNDRSR
ncbi:MAG: TIGR04282 family arsenosugar biosynthesis glycosyltransferase [Acidobacteria bacterium]|nr:TIGR04282 family arsenosugar biosynthesis glycosyltransferase [Acidobacteriota bacterium]